MIIVNNINSDDTISSLFAQELSDVLATKDTVKLTALPYNSKSFKNYSPSLIINVAFPTDFRSTTSGYSISAYKKTDLVDLTIYAFSSHINSSVTSGYTSLPNAPYASSQDIQLNLGFASNAADIAWYIDPDHRTALIADLIHLWYADYSNIETVDQPNIGILPDPYFLKQSAWSGTYSIIQDTYNGAPVKAAMFNGVDISITPIYEVDRVHIVRLLAKAVDGLTTIRVKTDGAYIYKDIVTTNTWQQLDFLSLNPSGNLYIGSTNTIQVTGVQMAPASMFGSMSSGYYFDDPRLQYSPIDPTIACRSAQGVTNKTAASSMATVQSLIALLNSTPINTALFTGVISEFMKHIGDINITEFAKIDPSKISIIYKDIEKNIVHIEDMVKKQNMMQIMENLKNSQIMVDHLLKSTLKDLFTKNQPFVKELENRAKSFGERLKVEGGK